MGDIGGLLKMFEEEKMFEQQGLFYSASAAARGLTDVPRARD
jgi:hypothetical protein